MHVTLRADEDVSDPMAFKMGVLPSLNHRQSTIKFNDRRMRVNEDVEFRFENFFGL